jgi:hypothetical protein
MQSQAPSEDGAGPEVTTNEQRTIFINQGQPKRFCSNSIT